MSKRKDRATKPWAGNNVMVLEARVSELECALGALWALWNDKERCRMKADYMRGHLSYANTLDTLEAPIITALKGAPDETDEERAGKGGMR